MKIAQEHSCIQKNRTASKSPHIPQLRETTRTYISSVHFSSIWGFSTYSSITWGRLLGFTTCFWNLSAMRLECGQVTELMKNRPLSTQPCCFQPSFTCRRPYCNCTYKSENSQRTRWCTAHECQRQLEITQFHTQTGLFPRKRDQSTEAEDKKTF